MLLLALRSFGIDEEELFCRMTYWQSKGYIQAVFPTMAKLAQFKAGSILSEMFPGDEKKRKLRGDHTADDLVHMGLFGRGGV
jgi:hypothetical protein